MVTPRIVRIKPWSHRRKPGLCDGHTGERSSYGMVTEKNTVTLWSDWKLFLSYTMVSKVNMVLNVHRNHEAY